MTTGGGAPPGARRGRADPRTRRTPRDPTRARTRTRARRPSRSGARAFPRRARLGTADLFARANDGIRIRGRTRRRSSRSDPNRAPRLRARARRRAPSVPGVRRDAPRGPRRGAGEGGGCRTRGRAPRLLEARNGDGGARRVFPVSERDPPVGASHRAAREIPFAPTRRAAVKLLTRQLTRPFVGLLRRCASRQPFFFRPRSPRRESSAARPPRSIPPGSIARGTGTPGARGTGSRRGPDARRAGFPGEGADARAPRNRHARDVTSRDLCQ